MKNSCLDEAIGNEALRKINSLGAQQAGTLSDSGMDLGEVCQGALVSRVQGLALKFVSSFPRSLAEFHNGEYKQLIDDFDVDNFGVAGGRLILKQLGIEEGSETFSIRARNRVRSHVQ